MSNYKNIKFKIGDSRSIIPGLIENNLNKRIGIFVDGPKDTSGRQLCEKTLEYSNLFFACLHDYSGENNETTFSTSKNQKFQPIAKDLDKNHPQRSQYPNGPGLWCKIK